MAIYITTNKPLELLTKIRNAARQPGGILNTWTYDSNTESFTHTSTTSNQWQGITFISKVDIEKTAGQLKFGIKFPESIAKERAKYSILHGRFIEMLLNYFHKDFSLVSPTNDLMVPDSFIKGEALT